ncbi:hypothetical protein ACLF6K_09310 [Streptomyces xanthophaeus]|uniref:hypothetical protein n=1 Tax=Streptomyces xanthophaeus TaxID=67385 RepID=UPI00398FECA0
MPYLWRLSSQTPASPISAVSGVRQKRSMASRYRGSPQIWEWFPQHVTFPGQAKAGTPEILLAEVSLDDEGSDWLEVSLDVEWTEEGLLNVWSAISVACWCEVNHNNHWLGGPRDPELWRAHAGLPTQGHG